jgi:uncharacterized membrane protein YcaP (DUF421 family)
VLALLQYAVSKLAIWYPAFHRVVSSEPTLVVENGKVLEVALRRELIRPADVEAAARSHGLGSLDEAAAIVLETDGSFSVIRRGTGPIDLLSAVKRVP